MEIANNYVWEAEKADGTIVREGGDLAGCVRFSLIPCVPKIIRHDIVGLPLRRRFCRGMLKTALIDQAMLPGFLLWENGSTVVATTEDLTHILQPFSLVRKRHDGEQWWIVSGVQKDRLILASPYDGTTKKIESRRYIPPPPSEYFHCVVLDTCRIYVRSSDGGVLVTPADYELYL